MILGGFFFSFFEERMLILLCNLGEGKEIWPAKQTMKENAKTSDDDEEICRGIECGSGAQKEVLAW
jgi:hypothetical protein